jgi:nucleotide-binding universal stress UspA family protein
MFEKILVPLDGSAIAQGILPCVKTLARRFGSSIILFHAAETPVEPRGRRQKEYAQETTNRTRSLAEEYLAGVAKVLRRQRFKVEMRVGLGGVAHTITDFADAETVDLIAMSTHGRSGLRRSVLGSVADRVLRQAHQPLLLVRPTGDTLVEEKPYSVKALIVPLDGSRAAEGVLPYAQEMAKTLKLEVVLIQVISAETTVQFTPMGPDTLAIPTDVLQRIDLVASGYLAGVGKDLQRQGVPVRWDVLRGMAAHRIVEFARETPGSMVVMTTHGRSGLRRWVLGSVADEVVRASGEPVLVVRPGRGG